MRYLLNLWFQLGVMKGRVPFKKIFRQDTIDMNDLDNLQLELLALFRSGAVQDFVVEYMTRIEILKAEFKIYVEGKLVDGFQMLVFTSPHTAVFFSSWVGSSPLIS
jgi:hypothetical protein